MTASTYDALSRLTGQGATTYGYNGNGVLTVRTITGSTDRSVQDLAAPLPQVLQTDPDSHEIYGLERLTHVELPSEWQTWYGTDALGSVRQTLDAHGAAQNATWYDPWGTVQNTSFTSFGFTGEISDGNILLPPNVNRYRGVSVAKSVLRCYNPRYSMPCNASP